MNDSVETTSWRNLREFEGVDLAHSFVLSWHCDSETLFVDIDVLLTPEHPFFEKPRPAEKVCIRPAIIEFPFCQSLTMNGGQPGTIPDVAASIGHGAIEDLKRVNDGEYEISGEFGSVTINAERPLLKLKGP